MLPMCRRISGGDGSASRNFCSTPSSKYYQVMSLRGDNRFTCQSEGLDIIRRLLYVDNAAIDGRFQAAENLGG